MNEQVEKLVAALTSGEYEQAQGRLHVVEQAEGRLPVVEGNKYCCLGVACEISELGGWVLSEGENFHYDIGGPVDKSVTLALSYLPDRVQDHYGFTDHMAAFTPEAAWISDLADEDRIRLNQILAAGHYTTGTNTSLIHLNDSGVSFDDIAWVIELNPPGLFTNVESKS